MDEFFHQTPFHRHFNCVDSSFAEERGENWECSSQQFFNFSDVSVVFDESIYWEVNVFSDEVEVDRLDEENYYAHQGCRLLPEIIWNSCAFLIGDEVVVDQSHEQSAHRNEDTFCFQKVYLIGEERLEFD